MEEPHHEKEKFWPFTVLEFRDKDPGINSITGGPGQWAGYSKEKYFGNYVSFIGLFYNYTLLTLLYTLEEHSLYFY